MRHSFFLFLGFVVFFSEPVSAKDIPVDSDLRAATVYSDRATLTRRAIVEVPKGAHTVTFTGLPARLFSDSLRAEGTARANVTFGAVTSKMESHRDYVVPKEKELNAQLVLLQDKRKILEAEKSALAAGKRFLDNLGKQAALRQNEEIAKIDLSPESWSVAADAISVKVAENLKASLVYGVEIRKVDKEMQKIRTELSRLRTGQKQTYSVSIPMESDAATTLTLDLHYQMPGVSWQPVYDARLETKTGDMTLIQYGSVWQRTGEDWDGIALTLSTAQPSRGTGLPDLPPQWVYLHQGYAKRKAGNFGMMAQNVSGGVTAASPAYLDAAEMVEEADMERALAPKEAKFVAAQINSEGFVGEYVIPGPSNVASDGTKAKLMIGGFETSSRMQVQVKPQLSNEAFVVVKTTLKGENPILPGQVSLFRDGAYIGQTHLPMLRPDDVQDIAFGVDDNVRVKRNVLKDEKSEAGLIAKDQVLERHFVRHIQNLHKQPIEVAVFETIPVSKDEKIRVDLLKDKTTQGYELDVDNIKGLLRWTMEMNPKQETDINLGWRVSWPKAQNISGL